MSSIFSASSLIDVAANWLYDSETLGCSKSTPPMHEESVKSNPRLRFKPPVTERESKNPIDRQREIV